MTTNRVELPEPLFSLAKESRRSEGMVFGFWGVLLTLGGGGGALYLAYYVLHRASIYDELRVRTEEWVAALVFVALLALGLVLDAAAWESLTSKDPAGLLGDPTKGITGVRRVVNRGGRWLVISIEGGLEVRFKFTALVPNEMYELQALAAVERLPQFRRRPAGPAFQKSAQEIVSALVASIPRPADGKRIACDAPWPQIAHAMRTAGLRLTSHVEEGVTLDPQPKDPIRAEFEIAGARAIYHRKPETGLQTVQVVGERAAAVFGDILNVGYLPVLESKIVPMLESGDRAAILRALGAIEFVHASAPGRLYQAHLERHAASDDQEIRAAATRARGA